MIEFKQIIGRGTRLNDGKDHFTVYDFVRAHLHFADPEWDGEPLDPVACEKCNHYPCKCEKAPPQPCPQCGRRPCECPDEPCAKCGQAPCACKKKVKVRLADGKERSIRHLSVTTYWHADVGGAVPGGAAREAPRDLHGRGRTARRVGRPRREGVRRRPARRDAKDHRRGAERRLRRVAYVAYELAPRTREERAEHARGAIAGPFTSKQRGFLDFVLAQYVKVGVHELDRAKLSPLPKLRYSAIADAVTERGQTRRDREGVRGVPALPLRMGTRRLMVRRGIAQPGCHRDDVIAMLRRQMGLSRSASLRSSHSVEAPSPTALLRPGVLPPRSPAAAPRSSARPS
jgi:type I restriction enzyme R subunit